MKKTTIMMLASATMLFAVPTVETTPQADTTTNQGMGKGMAKTSCKQGKCKTKRIKRKNTNSPFLIQKGLPHLSKIVMQNANDKSFALTSEQKEELKKVQTETKSSIAKTTPKIRQLRREIIKGSTSGTSAMELKSSVEKLAVLQAYATMVQLKCIEETKKILTKDQLLYLLANKRK